MAAIFGKYKPTPKENSDESKALKVEKTQEKEHIEEKPKETIA